MGVIVLKTQRNGGTYVNSDSPIRRQVRSPKHDRGTHISLKDGENIWKEIGYGKGNKEDPNINEFGKKPSKIERLVHSAKLSPRKAPLIVASPKKRAYKVVRYKY